MSETVQFWLDNKMSAGVKMAAIGDQQLVVYRDKFYVVENGAAQMKGSRPLHYSKSSLPLPWRKALRGETPPATALSAPPDEAIPRTTATRAPKARRLEQQESAGPSATPVPEPGPSPAPETKAVKPRPSKSAKPSAPGTVMATCPYCQHKHQIPLEKGKHGKPFFQTCARCKTDFAVRFVAVTTYQAQVAGFR